MGIKSLSSRAIQGMFYERIEQGAVPWFSQLAMKINSDQHSEEYKWLGQVPQMREWIGGRQPKGLSENGFTIKNKTFESTLILDADDVRLDKTAQVEVRVNELAERAVNHPVSLLSTLLINGAASVCYDGQYFFDTDHSEGSSGSQSNKITVDISALPVGTDFHGSTTAPSAEEMNSAILQGIQQIYSFKDDQGEPINETARNFIVMVPTTFWQPAITAVSNGTLRNGAANVIQSGGLSVTVASNPRLTWTDRFAVFSADGNAKPFIHQEEMAPTMQKPLEEDSEHAIKHNEFMYPVKARHNVGYGMWQKACQVILG